MARFKRHPIRNFIILPKVQLPYIRRTLVLAGVVSLVSLLCLIVVFYLKYNSGDFYYMTEDLEENLIRQSIWELVVPSLVVAVILALALALALSLYASRRIAVPLYKMQHWAQALGEGDLEHPLQFRKQDGLDELSETCNAGMRRLSTGLRQIHALLNEAGGEKSADAIILIASLDKYLATGRPQADS